MCVFCKSGTEFGGGERVIEQGACEGGFCGDDWRRGGGGG